MGLLDALRSGAQGASNAIASNVSAPVDALAWLLRKGGLPVNNPVGGSDWMAQQGLTAEPQNKIAGLLGEAVGGIGPAVVAAKAPQIAGGLLKMGENAMAPRALGKQAGVVSVDSDINSFLQNAKKGQRIRTDGSIYPSESIAKTPYDMGLINNYPEHDIQGFYLRRYGYDNISDASKKKEAAKEAFNSYLKDKKLSVVKTEAGAFDKSRYF